MPNQFWTVNTPLHTVAESFPMPDFNDASINEIMSTYKKTATKARSTSQWSDEYLDLKEQLEETTRTLRQESEELANVLQQQAKLAEVVRDTATLVQKRIAILQQVSIQLEKRMQSLRPQGLPETAPAPSEATLGLQPIAQPAGVAAVGFVPGLFVQDQG